MKTVQQKISFWLFTCAAAVFLMAVIGAVTRLTESGLSIVEWKPVTGALPPLGGTAWAQAFDLYKTSPQYQKVNLGMSLADFKQIYFWEYLHRLWGRMIGMLYFIPFLWFWGKKQIPPAARKPLLGILALGFLQGAMGWFMVKSGLIDQPAVSHYRLAVHLALAAIIFCCLFYMGLSFSVRKDAVPDRVSSLRGLVKTAMVLAAVTTVWGAFVAGLRAGSVYNTFPLMEGRLWPGEIFHMSPLWINFFENHATVQFTHRVLAMLTFLVTTFLVWKGLACGSPPRLRKIVIALGGVGSIQVGLGIATLLTGVNIVLATLHQAGALTILALFTALLYEIPQKGPVHDH